MAVPNQNPAPGWYPEASDPTIHRWWDGDAWTAHTTPSPQEQLVQVKDDNDSDERQSDYVDFLRVATGLVLIFCAAALVVVDLRYPAFFVWSSVYFGPYLGLAILLTWAFSTKSVHRSVRIARVVQRGVGGLLACAFLALGLPLMAMSMLFVGREGLIGETAVRFASLAAISIFLFAIVACGMVWRKRRLGERDTLILLAALTMLGIVLTVGAARYQMTGAAASSKGTLTPVGEARNSLLSATLEIEKCYQRDTAVAACDFGQINRTYFSNDSSSGSESNFARIQRAYPVTITGSSFAVAGGGSVVTRVSWRDGRAVTLKANLSGDTITFECESVRYDCGEASLPANKSISSQSGPPEDMALYPSADAVP